MATAPGAPHSPSLRVRWALGIASGGLLAGAALSPLLWVGVGRLYPRAPILTLARTSVGAEAVLVVLLLLGLGWGMTGRPRSRAALAVGIAALAMLVAGDQSRLQPWVYEYALLIVALGFRSPRPGGEDSALRAGRAVLIALYFWSSLQKVNVSFVTHAWPDFLGGVAARAPWLQHLGWLPPVAELGVALSLAARRLRPVGVAAAVLLHATNLTLLVASGENTVVWAWNVAMAALVVVLFAGRDARAAAGVAKRQRLREAVVFALAWWMPALSFVDLWDSYLSAALYSGNTLEAVIVLSSASLAALPPLVQRNTWQQSEPEFIDLNRWSYDELNVPAYPAARVQRAVAFQTCRAYLRGAGGTLVLLGRPDWRTGERARTKSECPPE
jgi:hypothetical protein